MKSIIKYILVLSLIFSFTHVFAQSERKSKVKLDYYQDFDKSEKLVSTLIVKEDRYVPYANATLKFYTVNDSSRVFLEELVTDENGKVTLVLDPNAEYYNDSLGLYTFEVEFEGDDVTKSSDEDVSFYRSDLEISFFQKDSIKSIIVKANQFDAEGNKIPIDGKNIVFYVKGTFSLLNIGKEKTDDMGVSTTPFPIDIPGDTAGFVTIVAKIESEKKLGTIETRGEINWGEPIAPVKAKKRGLGDTDAPLWMVYTLISLLSIVWFTYFYVIYLIVKVKITH